MFAFNYKPITGEKMFKNLLLIALVSALFVSCAGTANQEEQAAESKQETTMEPVAVSVADFENKAGETVGQTVMITGTVDHVCQHGGKRMFLVDQGTDGRIKVVTGENMASFNTDLEGNDVKVIGTVDELRIDDAYLVEWENELMMESDAKMKETSDGSGHEGSEKGEEADQGEHIAGMEQIANYRKEMEEKGVDHLSFYSIVASEYEVVEEPETESM